MEDENTYDVALVGGGPTGLASSILLSLCNISHVLFERYPSTSIHPKACGYNQRTNELFRILGIEDEVIKQRAPKSMAGQTAWYTSFGKDSKQIARRDAWGGGGSEEEYSQVSPSSYSIMPQIRLEPILQKRALELNPASVLYNTEVTDIQDTGSSVSLNVQTHGKSAAVFRAKYCIVADGGRRFTDSLDVEWEGERDIVDMVSAHIKAPLSLHHPDTRNFITWFINPRLGGSIGSGYLYHLGPYPTSKDTEEWLFACALNPNDPKVFDKSAMLERLHDTLQIPNLDVELLTTSHWNVNALCAKQYRNKLQTGRVFLVGDAAHRIPPWGALGLNTGLQDAYNLVWKLKVAIDGLQSGNQEALDFNALLDTYDAERRPIGQRVRDTSLHNLRAHSLVMDTALGLSPDNSEEQNVRATDAFFDTADHDEGAARREAVDRAQRILDDEFHALGAEIGWFYPELDLAGEGALTRHDGQLDADGKLDLLYYHPSTIPGHHLPHVWLERHGERKSTRDLIPLDGFLLLTSRPDLWTRSAVELGNLVRLAAIASEDGGGASWQDVEARWPLVRGVSDSGAVLVRPDGIVVWRANQFDESQHASDGWLKSVVWKALKLN